MHATPTKKRKKEGGGQIEMAPKSLTMATSMNLYKIIFLCGYVNKENRLVFNRLTLY